MKWNEMPIHLRNGIYQQLGGDINTAIDPVIVDEIEAMSPFMLMDTWLAWEGIIGFTRTITHAYELFYNRKESKS